MRKAFPIMLGWFALFALASAAGAQLAVVATDPVADRVDAPRSGSISVTFDRSVDPATVDGDSFWAFGRWSGGVSGTLSLASGDTVVRLTPAQPLSPGESVLVVLSHDLRGADGSSLRDAGYSFQFWAAAKRSGLVFEPAGLLETGSPSRPYGGVAADFNGDGHLDLTTVNEDTDDLRVFVNPGDGAFGSFLQPTAGTGNVPSPSETADFDRDGNMDLVTGNTIGGSLSILLGNGDGTFGVQQEIPLGSQVRGVAVLDVDGDGDPDIAATLRSTGEVAVVANGGAGVFGTPKTFATTNGAGAWALATADMNQDGILDLVVGNNAASRIEVHLGNGDGTFTPSEDEPAGGSPWMLALGDIDLDGNADVSSANNSGNGTILLGDGAGGLGSALSFSTDPFALATDLADLDGDGDLDWMVASFGGDWTLFRNDAAGFVFAGEFAAPEAASCSLAMDLDGDGDLDLALIDELADQVLLRRNISLVFRDGFEDGSLSAWDTAVP